MTAPLPLRVLSLESRRGDDMRSLIERQGAHATIAPSLREIPIADNPAALAFGDQLLRKHFELVIFLTGVGARGLLEVLQTRYAAEEIFEALRRVPIIVRGPKPAAVLREWKVPFAHQVREPNTWRELLELLDTAFPVQGKKVAVQEYGQPNPALYEGLTARQAIVTPVPVYRWTLPEDITPLQEAIRETIAEKFDVILWTSAYQANNVLHVAEELGLQEAWLHAARKCVIGSIGPTASENLTLLGLPPDLEPSHPKMGHLVIETLAAAWEILSRK